MARKKRQRQTKQERLQAMWDALPEIYAGGVIEFRPFDGWYIDYDELRHFGDEGDYLGANHSEAQTEILWLAAAS